MWKWLATKQAAWGEALVLLALGGLATYLEPKIGVPVLVVLLLAGLYLIWRSYKAPKAKTTIEGANAKLGTLNQPIMPTPSLFIKVDESSFGNSGDSGWPQLDHGTLLLRILCSFSTTTTMLIESVKLGIAGEEPVPAIDCKSHEVNIVTEYLYFPVAKSVSQGQHNIKLMVFAEGKWWASKDPFSVDVPKR